MVFRIKRPGVGLAAAASLAAALMATTVTPSEAAPVAAAGNLALNRPVTATSTQANGGFNAAAANAVDGNAGTRWGSVFADPQSITVDLGVERPLTRVVLSWENAAARAYQVQVSNDGGTFTTAYSTTVGNGGVDTINLSTSGRYLRVLGTARTTAYGYSLFEIEAYSGTSTTPPPPAPGGWTNSWTAANPLVGQKFWVDPNSNAAKEIAKRGNDGAAVAALRKISSRSNSTWLGDWMPTASVAGVVNTIMNQAASSGSVPVLVTYAIPNRDCGYYSGGGFNSPTAYNDWVRQVAAGINNRKAIVVIEPDSLGVVDCLSSAALNDRYSMLRNAVTTLRAAGAVVYLDAGTSNWVPVATMSDRLRQAGVANARGFAANVSNFRYTNDVLAYGNAISANLGGAKFVVDTSRNGLGDATGISEPWCNPPGRALGPPPSTTTGSGNADAYLWIKSIGESDGTCNRGNPAAGTWWPEYAIGLAQRAAF